MESIEKHTLNPDFRNAFTQKWAQVLELREIAWALKASRIRSQNPDWPDDHVQAKVKKIFLHGTT